MSHEFRGREWDEYKLLQEKLDRIGDFRFRVKTWCVGVFTGFLVAGAAADVCGITYLLSLAVVAAFWLLEKHHVHWQRALTRRAAYLERFLQRQPASTTGSDGTDECATLSSPRIVDAIITADDDLRNERYIGWVLRRANGIFYLILVFIAIVLACLAMIPRPDRVCPVEFRNPVRLERHAATNRDDYRPTSPK
jgi:hypothetical protein